MKPSIVFIHGMFLNDRVWEDWTRYFTSLGYECSAPCWPLHEGDPAELRRNVPEGLGKLSLVEVHEHFRREIARCPDQPVVIGHSLGGLIVQKLVNEGLVRAGVAICPVAPNRMLAFDWSFLRNTASIVDPFAGADPYEMTAEGFHRNFANTLDESESRAAFEAYAVHESRQVLRDIMGDEGKVDVDAPHAPLLMIGADMDEIIPSTLVMRNVHAYTDTRSHHEYAGFTDRSHFICKEPGWEEVAAKCANWLAPHLQSLRS